MRDPQSKKCVTYINHERYINVWILTWILFQTSILKINFYESIGIFYIPSLRERYRNIYR